MIQNLVRTFVRDEILEGEMEAYLNKCGHEEFRLHTCEPLNDGSVLTVMERYVEISEAQQPDLNEATNTGGMAMKG